MNKSKQTIHKRRAFVVNEVDRDLKEGLKLEHSINKLAENLFLSDRTIYNDYYSMKSSKSA